MALVKYNDAERDYSAVSTTYNGAGQNVDVTMYQRAGLWTVIAGADAGSSLISGNLITVTIDDEDYRFNPLSRRPQAVGYLLHKVGDVYTMRINTTEV